MFLLSVPVAAAVTPVAEGPWEHVQVQTAALEMHTLQAGPADAPVVLLLHGFPDASYGWRGVIPLLSEDYRVIAPDLRGYGGTDKPEDGYDLPTIANDIVALLDALEVEQAHVIGHDWGAATTWQLATASPDRLLSATALDVPHPGALKETWDVNPEQREYKKFANLMGSRWTPRFLANIDEEDRAGIYAEELVDPSVFGPEQTAFYFELLNEVEETQPPLRYYRTNFSNWGKVWEAAEAAPDVTVPTLVLWGEEDSYMLVENAARSCEHVAAECVSATHPEAGHWLSWEQPEWVVEQWRAFTE